jgi:hypothetical protein
MVLALESCSGISSANKPVLVVWGRDKKGGCCHTTSKADERKGLRHSKIYSLVSNYTRSTGLISLF